MINQMGQQAEIKDRLQEALNIREKKAIDLSKDLGIPKSAISQYLSGKSKNMPSERIYKISKYLGVSEAWLMGFDVPMERVEKQDKEEKSTDNDGLTENQIALMNFVKSVPEDKAGMVLRVMKSILEDD